MAFRGKASNGCAQCRSRKTKCGQETPACSQCIRAGRKCPGYRDPLSLLFCDQRKYAETKVLARESRRRNVPGRRNFGSSKSVTERRVSDGLARSCAVLSPSIAPPLEDVAICFYFAQYIDCSNDQLDYRLNLLEKQPPRGILSVAISAVGAAGLARTRGAQGLKTVARQRYGLALSLTNAALRDPVKVLEDETLASVLLLGLYEVINCESRQSMQSWHSHSSGATELVRLRGRQQLQRENGQRLFSQVLAQTILTCLQKGEPLPDWITQWTQTPQLARTDLRVQANSFSDIFLKVCSIHATVRSGASVDSSDVVHACTRINAELTQWVKSLPSTMAYATVVTETNSEDVYDSQYHVYGSLREAYLWNSYRSARIITNKLLVELLKNLAATSASSDSSTLATQYHQSLSYIHQSTSDTFASVPFHLGYHRINKHHPRALGTLAIIWPLYTVACLKFTAGPARQWAARRLEWMGHAMGIQQAVALGSVLRKRGESEDNFKSI